jgi:hypothetical protein
VTVTSTYDPIEIAISFVDKEPVEVRAVNVRTSFPKPTQRQRTSLATALGGEAPDLTPDGRWVIARSVAEPSSATNVLRAGCPSRYAGDSALTMLPTDVELASLIVLDQPRGADTPTAVQAPKVSGELDADGEPLPQMIYEFKTFADLINHIRHAVDVTIQSGQNLETSILSSQVSKPILAVVATIRITEEPGTDGPIEIHALVPADGNTRTVCSLVAALGGEFSAEDLPDAIAKRMVHRVGAAISSAAHHKGRAAVHAKALDEFYGAAGDITNPNLVRYGQTTLIPAEIIIGFRRFGPKLAERSFEFVDAVRSDVGQQHSLSKAWPTGAVSANVGGQAIARAAAEGHLLTVVGKVAEGVQAFAPAITVQPLLDVPVEDEDSEPAVSTLDPGLARAVWLSQALTQPGPYDHVKRHIRALGGHKQVDKKTYARHIAATLWREWAPFKSESHSNEAAAWRVGGAIPHTLIEKRWKAMFPAKWVDLVPIALDAEDPRQEDAKATLMVAGGLALVADGQILAASGSTEKGANGQEYRRSQPPVVIADLGDTAAGLWTLAHAAGSFRSTLPASNAFSKPTSIPKEAYTIAFPSSADPSVPVTNENGAKLSYDRVRDLVGLRVDGGSDDGKEKPTPLTDRELLVELRKELANKVDQARKLQMDLDSLVSRNPGFRPMVDMLAWQSLDRDARKLAAAVTNWEPEEDCVDEDEDDDAGTDAASVDDDLADVDDDADDLLDDELEAVDA